MGREARCVVHRGDEQAEAKVLLESDELIVRAPFGLRLPRAEITARAEGDRLMVEWPRGNVALELGEREAARWAHEIANPKSLADKLGVQPEQTVLLVGAFDVDLVGAGTLVEGGPANVVFVSVETADDLARIEALQEEISSDGAIWVIRPKGHADLTEAMVIAAGRDAGLTDIKIAKISDTHTG
ncbi:MAG: hypothetical protein QOG02_1463, partial [Gaiellales bacterium]|nr:hypothetical protein [Gaiellales bacterium]